MSKEETKVEEKVEAETKETETKETEAKAETKEEPNKKEKKKKDKDKERIQELEAEVANLKNDYLKVIAEMQNMKRRLTDDFNKEKKYASQKVVSELINPVDMMVKIVNMPASTPEVQNYCIGFQMIANQLVDILKAEGLSEIKAEVGDEFNPAVHSAVETVEVEDDENKIVAVMQTGYMYKDRVLKPTMVKVSKKKAVSNEENFETQGDNVQ